MKRAKESAKTSAVLEAMLTNGKRPAGISLTKASLGAVVHRESFSLGLRQEEMGKQYDKERKKVKWKFQ